MQPISKYISYAEATKSQTATRLGLRNDPDEKVLAVMRLTAQMIFDPVREWHGKPIAVTSFFRAYPVNKAVGGDKSSDHPLGRAIDMDADVYDNGITNLDIYNYISVNLDFDQLIMEGENSDGTPAWIHASYRNKQENRRQKLKIVFTGGKKTVIRL